MFVILDIKFRIANIKWNLCQNTVKFQNMTSLVDKVCTNIQTSTVYYLLIEYLQVCLAVTKSHGYYSLCLRAGQSCTVFRILYEQQWHCCLLPQVFLLV